MSKFEHSIKVPQTYKVAAKIAKQVKTKRCGLKNLVYSSNKHMNIRGLNALIIKAFHHEDFLKKLIEKSKILVDTRVDPWLIRILITELLFGRKRLEGDSKPVKAVLSHHKMFLAELVEGKKAGTLKLDPGKKKGNRPRYVRVNTLTRDVVATVNSFRVHKWEQVFHKQTEGYASFLHKVASLAKRQFMQDFHIKELLIFPQKTEFFKDPLSVHGHIILQDKASCLASWLLNPPPGSITLDMCAAPGMKTTHLASLMKNKGILFAVERIQDRYKTLCNIVEKHGAQCVRTMRKDALHLDAVHCPGVQYILIDPTCSGSGVLDKFSSQNEEKDADKRLNLLADIQSKLLCHALTKFPDVKRIVYSTCSINIEENEKVVEKALAFVNTDVSNPIFEVVDTRLSSDWIHHGSTDFKWGPRCIYAKPKVDLTNGFFIAVLERVGSVFNK